MSKRGTGARIETRHTIYMRGWDGAITGNRANPYRREDFRRWWKQGYDDCMANKSLPNWYGEWKKLHKDRKGRM